MEAKGLFRAFTLWGVTCGTVECGKHRPAVQTAASTWALTQSGGLLCPGEE